MKDKRTILLLGGFGFIGRNLMDAFLNDRAYNIVVFEIRKPKLKLANANGVKAYYGDFVSGSGLEKVFRENRIDIVFHLASTTTPATSNQDANKDVRDNLVGSLRLLEMMNKYRVPKIVYFSSGGAIYDSSNGTLLAEDSPTNPLSSYGIVKLAVEKYILLYRHLYGLDYLILRACNPYGPYHHSVSQGLINVTLKKILAKEPVIVWGDGRAIKDYIYVRDYAAIVRRLVKKNVWNEIINVGTGRGHSVNQILSAIKSVAGSFKVKYQAGRQIDAPRVVLDIKKLRRLIRPDFVPLKQGIAKTFDWLKQHHE